MFCCFFLFQFNHLLTSVNFTWAVLVVSTLNCPICMKDAIQVKFKEYLDTKSAGISVNTCLGLQLKSPV